MTKRLMLALALLLLQADLSTAQTKGAAAPDSGQKPASAAPNDPNFKSVGFGDWTLHCQSIGAAPQVRRSCEVVQTINLKDQTAPFAEIALGKPSPTEAMMVTVVVPINVSFPSSVQIAVNEKDNQIYELIWKRCLPGGCFASVVMKDEIAKKWRGLNEASGRVRFKNAAAQDVVMPMSFKGLAQALDALAKEP